MRYIDGTTGEVGKTGAYVQKIFIIDIILYSLSLLFDIIFSSYSLFNFLWYAVINVFNGHDPTTNDAFTTSGLYVAMLDISAALLLFWGSRYRDIHLLKYFIFLQVSIWVMKIVVYCGVIYLGMLGLRGDRKRSKDERLYLLFMVDPVTVVVLLPARIVGFISGLQMRAQLMQKKDAMIVSVNGREEEDGTGAVVVSAEEMKGIINH
eukprot:TRINITY_DN6752_c0_g1_i1.p1 TRINITY_DN6752_c0_g1~~TRINITY_DN6752_c0_g1_i1.p1  ORF type:complete len:207 (-),score=18.15 TRINITY_DN6752_c0_g1_i1:45-665(-)